MPVSRSSSIVLHLLLIAGLGGCASAPDDGTEGPSEEADEPLASAALHDETFGDVTFHLPRDWHIKKNPWVATHATLIHADPDAPPMGISYYHEVEIYADPQGLHPFHPALKPWDRCYYYIGSVRYGTVAPVSVDVVGAAPQSIGGEKAEYRAWRIECPDGRVRFNRMWVSAKLHFVARGYGPRAMGMNLLAHATVHPH